MGYHHFGTEIFYDKPFINYKVCDGTGEDKKCADKWFGIPFEDKDHLHIFNDTHKCR